MRHALERSTIAAVADDPRPPVAIRLTRPYASEEEYLEQELDLLSRTGITLVGAQPRPQGVVLRFELVLAAGQVLLRGEGRVVGFKPNAHQGVGGLSLRFTRIDARSKALLDKAAALREKRRPSTRPSRAPPPALSSSVAIDGQLTPPPSSVEEIVTSPVRATPTRAPTPEVSASPRERDALLDRLRVRAKGLDPTAVRSILERRRNV
jgi:molecular chaperone DnaK